jgi:copper(I)-binding protein
LKTSIGITAVALCFGLATLTVHVAASSGTEKTLSAGAARSPAVTDAWARATVPKQPVAAAYMKISSTSPVTLIRIETDAAKQVQVHNMQMNEGVMQMRKHDQVDIPAGKTIELAPGGMHLMLLGLKKPLKAGDAITVKMTFVDAEKAKVTSVVTVPVRPLGQ